MPRSTGVEWADDRHTLASFCLWLIEHGRIGRTAEDVIAVMLAPRSWEDDYADYCAVVEAENEEQVS